jgi:hypothetical protein
LNITKKLPAPRHVRTEAGWMVIPKSQYKRTDKAAKKEAYPTMIRIWYEHGTNMIRTRPILGIVPSHDTLISYSIVLKNFAECLVSKRFTATK